MTPVDPRTLKPGQRVRWTRTVEGVVRADHVTDVEIQTADGDGHSIVVGRAGAVDTFELLAPPLPSEDGDVIVARLDGHSDKAFLLERRFGDWEIHGPGLCGTACDEDVLPGWVQVDPKTLLPIELDGVHTVPVSEEPPCPFADEHERWGLTTARAGEPGTSRDGVDGTLVECSRCGPGYLLLDPDEEQPGSAPEAERPVPPKGLGAVIKARVLGESYDSTLVRAVTGDHHCWHSLASSGATWWFSDDQVTVTEVLHPGIEVPR